jgi:hypothetical protein
MRQSDLWNLATNAPGNQVTKQREDFVWIFLQKISISGKEMQWNTLLSDYLFSFILSTILRYYPHQLGFNTKDSYIAEAWCNQAAIESLREYVMLFTNPMITLN